MSDISKEPAFPQKVRKIIVEKGATVSDTENFGVTKLELFSAMAMQGIVAHPFWGENDREWIANEAYAQAKALIAELEKERG